MKWAEGYKGIGIQAGQFQEMPTSYYRLQHLQEALLF